MATKKSMWVFFGILVISVWGLASAIQAWAETVNYKVYTYTVKRESIPVGDVEEHNMMLDVLASFLVFENGEVATAYGVGTGDMIKMYGPAQVYSTWTYADGSTIIIKTQFTVGGATAGGTSEIIKGTGRFEGIKGTLTGKSRFLPAEKWEAGPKRIGEGTITYTLPSK